MAPPCRRRSRGSTAAAAKPLLTLMAMIAAATALLLARPAAAVTVLCTELAFLPRSAWNSSGVDGRPAPRSLIESLAPWWGNAVRARELATAVAFSQDAAFTPSNYYTTLRGAAFAYAGNATHVSFSTYSSDAGSGFLGVRAETQLWADAIEIWAVPMAAPFQPTVAQAANVTFNDQVTLTAGGSCGGGTCAYTWVVQYPYFAASSCCSSGVVLTVGPTNAASFNLSVGHLPSAPTTLSLMGGFPSADNRQLRVQLLATRLEDGARASPVSLLRDEGNINAYITMLQPPPSVAIDNAASGYNVTAGGAATVLASDSDCNMDVNACRSTWTLECPGRATVNVTYTGLVRYFPIMTGPSQYREVDTTRLNGTLVCTATFALATPAGRAAASTAVTVRPAPLDCGAAVYSVPAVNATGATRTGSAVCGSYKDARNGKAPKFVTNVTIGVTDPQGFAAVVAITNVTTNVNPALHPSCGRCKAGRRETCGCVQIAEALGAGRARLMPQPQFKINRTYVDLSYKIYYTATVAETGSSCTGSVVLCHTRDPAKSTCRPFGSPAPEFPAMVCGGARP